jgi:hypothetical protein
MTQRDNDSKIVSLEISSPFGGRKFHIQNVRTISQLNLPSPSLNLLESLKNYDHLKDLSIPDVPFTTPGILIGLQHVKLTLSYEIREGTWNEPVATLTRLGWAIYGKLGSNIPEKSTVATCHICECTSLDPHLHDLVKKFFTTESFGVKVVERCLESKEDVRAREIFESTVKKVGKRYETGLLWRENPAKLPDNRDMAHKRLICFENRLAKDPALKKAAIDKMNSHIEKGYLRKVSEQELSQFKGQKWFLPVFATVNPN